jgi:hypothetical protein
MGEDLMNPTLLRLEHALKNSSLLSQWEAGFIESLHQQFKKRGSLSARQLEILERVEQDKLSEEARHTSQVWQNSYDDEKRRIARICAEYYDKTGYFTALASSILEDSDYTPPEKAWRKMCENKYAKKVLALHDADPKYPVGSTVMFRATADWAHRYAAGDKPCIVIATGGIIKSAAKGAKPYKVLPYGLAKPIECEERHLKTYKKSKKTKKVVDKSIPF